MKVNLYKDYWLTSSVGDRCFTLKTIKKIQDKKSKNYGQESEVTISYPVTIGSAVDTIYKTEMFNSSATTLEQVVKEEKILQDMVIELAKHIGVDNFVKNIVFLSDDVLSKGGYDKANNVKDEISEDDEVKEKPKRGRKKKEE